MIAVGMTGDLAVIDDHRAKAGAINADHVMTIAGGRGTSGAAIRVVEIKRPQAPQLDLKVDFVPDADGVESIAKEIKLTGRSIRSFKLRCSCSSARALHHPVTRAEKARRGSGPAAVRLQARWHRVAQRG